MSDAAVDGFLVTAELAGKTLAAVVRLWKPGTSWEQARKLIESRCVQVQGAICFDPVRRLCEGERLTLAERPMVRPDRAADLVVRHLDGHLVVVEKPAGISTVRHWAERDWTQRRKDENPTLDELLQKQVARRERLGGRSAPLRTVQRLDRETSGLLVFARTPSAAQGLVQQFRKHTVQRHYIALIPGSIREQKFESRLVRDRGDGFRGSSKLVDAGKVAITHVKPLEKIGEYQLVECRLETGRTHQIRIHLSEHGHPVCGDRVYRQPLFKPPIEDHSGAPRLFLHAAELGFVHPATGQAMHFEMELPMELRRFLDRLRTSAKPGKRREAPPTA